MTQTENRGNQMSTTRKPQQFATYRGDASNVADEQQVVGPNTLGEYLVAVTADYDAAIDKTRVGFAYMPKDA